MKDNNKIRANKIFIAVQVLVVMGIFASLTFLYPKATLSLNGHVIKFNQHNAKVIIIADNPEFLNSRYFYIENNNTISLRPGKYYWKASNGILEGISRELVIDSDKSFDIDNNFEGELIETKDIRVNFSRSNEGTLIGSVILSPEDGGENEL